MKNRFFALAACCLLQLSVSSRVVADPVVNVYLDSQSAGWAYKTFDYAFVAGREGCRIQWNAEEGKDGSRRLSIRRDCKAGFLEQLPLHRAILKEITQKWPLPSFKSMAWGPLCADKERVLCGPIIRASLQSKDYIDYYRHYPHSKLKDINGLFVGLANSSQSYAPLAGLLREFGVHIHLLSVEKVFEARLQQTPFAEEYKSLALDKSPLARVMVDAGSWWFSLAPSGQ